MTDLITLQCPRCGGTLRFTPGTLALSCEHCGAQHVVRNVGDGFTLESHARCPQCGRNDKAEKVSAILKTQTHDIDGYTFQTITATKKGGRAVTERVQVPIHTSQKSDLASRLVPPARPNPPQRPPYQGSNWALLSAVLLFFLGLYGLVVEFGPNQKVLGTRLSGAPDVLLAVACIATAAAVYIWVVPRERARNASILVLYKASMASYNALVERQAEEYELAKHRWEQLYYCSRDDCVFLPGTDTHASVDQLDAYLFGRMHALPAA